MAPPTNLEGITMPVTIAATETVPTGQKPLKRCDFSAPLTAIAYATRVFDMEVIAPDGQAPKSNRIGNAKMHSRSPIGFDVSGREAAQ